MKVSWRILHSYMGMIMMNSKNWFHICTIHGSKFVREELCIHFIHDTGCSSEVEGWNVVHQKSFLERFKIPLETYIYVWSIEWAGSSVHKQGGMTDWPRRYYHLKERNSSCAEHSRWRRAKPVKNADRKLRSKGRGKTTWQIEGDLQKCYEKQVLSSHIKWQNY